MNLIGLFATPLVSDFYDCTEEEFKFLDGAEMYDEWSGDYGNKSKNTYILNEPELKGVSDFILNMASNMMKDILGFDVEGVQFTQSWVTHKNPGEYHATHSHANSIVSGVYYFQKDIEQMPPITFYKSRSSTTFELLPKYFTDNSERPFSWDRYTYVPAANNVIMFPSYLQHSVSRNETNTVRKSIAFNIIPTHSFGLEYSLTQLKFEGLK